MRQHAISLMLWDTYTRVRCVASQVRLQNERLDTVKRPSAPGPSFGACMAHTLGELGRSQLRVLGAAQAVGNGEQRRLRGKK